MPISLRMAFSAQALQPVFADHDGVVVQKHEDIARGHLHAVIIEPGPLNGYGALTTMIRAAINIIEVVHRFLFR